MNTLKKFVVTVSVLGTLAACKIGGDANRAEVMVKAQVPTAKCTVTKLGKTDVALCDIAGKDKIVQYIAVYGDNGFKVYPLVDEKPAEGQGQGSHASPPATPPAPPVPAPDAGVK